MPVNGREYEFESATFKETETTTFNAKYKDGGPATFEISKAEVKEFLESLKPGGVVLGAQFTAKISYADTDQAQTTDTLELIFQCIKDSDGKATITCKQSAPLQRNIPR